MFIPRSIKRKHQDDAIPCPRSAKRAHTETCTSPAISHDDDDNTIKALSADQRLILPGQDEPECIICGKYGEYINNDTDNDVCSLECKRIDKDLYGHGRTRATLPESSAMVVYAHVASNVHAKLTNYQEPIEITTMPKQQVEAMLAAHHIKVEGNQIPRPVVSFDQLRDTLGQRLLDNLESMSWSMAQGLQRQAVPVALCGRDMHVTAPTGSGKTAAFLIPILVHSQSLNAMYACKRRAGPYALVLAPTRHECEKIEGIAKQLARGMRNMRTGLLIGGQSLAQQRYRLGKGVQIVIGTPSRVLQFMTHHPHLLRAWRAPMIVLQNTDTLLGHGFQHQTRKILGQLPDKVVRQFLLFSSYTTHTQEQLQKLHRRLVSPIRISVAE